MFETIQWSRKLQNHQKEDKKKKQIVSLYGEMPPSFEDSQDAFHEEPEMGEGEKL